MIKLTTVRTFDPMYGFRIIPAGTELTLRPTNYSNYVYYIMGCDFHALGYPVTSWDMEKAFGENWELLIN